MNSEIRLEAKKEPETWVVAPTPGYVLKFKEAHVVGREEKSKAFINVCHCTQLPPPTDDLTDEQLAERIDNGDYSYKIPICVGEIDYIDDRGGQPAIKIDVLVNSVFYEKHLSPPDANFYRHFVCMVMAEAVENKHNIAITPNEAIKLNRKRIGEISPMTICKRPPVPVVHELASGETDTAPKKAIATADSLITSVQPNNVSMRLLSGEKLEIRLVLDQIEPPLNSPKRLKVKLSPDRLMVLLDNQRSLFDFCFPYNVDETAARSKLTQDRKALVISAPIVFS